MIHDCSCFFILFDAGKEKGRGFVYIRALCFLILEGRFIYETFYLLLF